LGNTRHSNFPFYRNEDDKAQYRGDTLGFVFQNVDLDTFFDQMAALEDILGGPQYIEWAMTLDAQGQPTFWITQIDDLRLAADTIDFIPSDDILCAGFDVTGVGQRLCQDIVFIEDAEDLDKLAKYNRTHAGYVVIYASSLITSFGWMRAEDTRQINFMDISNAAVVLEVQKSIGVGGGDHSRGQNPISHWKGKLDWTKKLFAQLRYENIQGVLQAMRRAWTEQKEGTLHVFPFPVQVTASPRLDKLVVALADDKARIEDWLTANGATPEKRAEWDKLARDFGIGRYSNESPDDLGE
jgi:hypothetical protein